jgi:DNA modification methylase
MPKNTEALEVIELSLDKIEPYDDNPRDHPDEQIAMLKKSVNKHGFNNPVLIGPADDVAGKHELIAGHARLQAAKQLGMSTVPAIILSHLDGNERRAYRLADNAIALKGDWSMDLLQEEMAFQMEWDLEFDAEALGFEVGEADALAEAFRSEFDEEEEEAPPAPSRERDAISELGTIWQIGPHRIACGSALDPELWGELMDGREADVVISDMPFNVPVNGHVSSSGQHSEFAQASGEMSEQEFADFVRKAFELQERYARPGSLSYQFIDWRSVELMIREGRKIYERLINLCVWVKPAAGMGSLYRSRHELVCVFHKGGAPHQNNVELGKHGRFRTNVWEYAGCTGFSEDREDNLAMHPTVKNTQMIADAIMDSTAAGDLVVDAFLGSGTSALAAARTKRHCFGIEIDPHYVDLAVERLLKEVGGDAVDQKGASFRDHSSAR